MDTSRFNREIYLLLIFLYNLLLCHKLLLHQALLLQRNLSSLRIVEYSVQDLLGKQEVGTFLTTKSKCKAR